MTVVLTRRLGSVRTADPGLNPGGATGAACGFGYRSRDVATPYLWSYSQHYTKGRFVADHVFNPNAVSKQAGAAVLLKALQAKALTL